MASAALQDLSAANSGSRARFVLTICVGSFLLFLVQPMVAKMALPRLGGAPAVWNSAMLVYQALLLAGYAYAHWLGRFATRTQACIHIGAFSLAAVMLPIGLVSANPPVDANPLFWVPWLFVVSIGPLFFVVAAQAPLMQRWYALSGGENPYPLYAASNFGSFGGLIAYPLLVEPLMPIEMQRILWTVGYGLLLVLVGWCAVKLPRDVSASKAVQASAAPPSRRMITGWILLAAVPSGLMLSTSLHLTTDIMAMPLLWVAPLGLYLLSFSVAFADNRTLANFFTRLAPFALLFAACSVFIDVVAWPITVAAVALICLFVISVTLHSAMFDRRPDPAYLTQFYLSSSVGGVVGGLFCALLAPLVFNWTYEHPIILVASALLITPRSVFERTQAWWSDKGRSARIMRWTLVGLLFVSMIGQGAFGIPDSTLIAGAASIVIIAVGLLVSGNRMLFAGVMIALMLSMNGWTKLALSSTPGMMTRSFFGVYSLRKSNTSNIIVHGTTVHGVQNIGSTAREVMPTTYYAPKSGIGLAMRAAPKLYGAKARIGVVGLGAGTLACYKQPGQSWRFYEIDPAMVVIARDAKRFTFLSRCQPDADIRIGDARLVLAGEADREHDLLAIDAFSSDAVPMHLLTREAFQTYRARITDNGVLLVHISNRYLDLEPVLAAIERDGWIGAVRDYQPDPAETKLNYTHSIWIALSPKKQTLDRLIANDPANPWRPLHPRLGFSPWTDDHASILSVIKPYKRN